MSVWPSSVMKSNFWYLYMNCPAKLNRITLTGVNFNSLRWKNKSSQKGRNNADISDDNLLYGEYGLCVIRIFENSRCANVQWFYMKSIQKY